MHYTEVLLWWKFIIVSLLCYVLETVIVCFCVEQLVRSFNLNVTDSYFNSTSMIESCWFIYAGFKVNTIIPGLSRIENFFTQLKSTDYFNLVSLNAFVVYQYRAIK